MTFDGIEEEKKRGYNPLLIDKGGNTTGGNCPLHPEWRYTRIETKRAGRHLPRRYEGMD